MMCMGWFLSWILVVLLTYQINNPPRFNMVDIPNHFTVGFTTFQKSLVIIQKKDTPITVSHCYFLYTTGDESKYLLYIDDNIADALRFLGDEEYDVINSYGEWDDKLE